MVRIKAKTLSNKKNMIHNVRKYNFGHVHPAKIQISLRIRTAWSEPVTGYTLDNQGCKVSIGGKRRLWSDCTYAQAYLNIRWAHVSEDAFLFLFLKLVL